MVDKQNAGIILGIGVGLIILALLLIPINQSAPSHATDVSNDQPPIFISQGGNNNSTNNNTNIPCTYLIFISVSNMTNAKNCSTGKIDYSNKNPYTTIEQAINSPAITNITANHLGGEIYLKAGIYSLNHRIDLNVSDVTLTGENEIGAVQGGHRNYATVFKQANGANIPQMIFMTGTFGDTLKYFYIDCNAVNNPSPTTGIFGQGILDEQIENVAINFCSNVGLYLQDSIAGFFKDVHAESGSQGIFIFGTASGGGTIGNRFVGLYADNANNSTSFTIEGNSKGNTFTGNIAREDKGRCFYIFFASTFGSPSQNTFVGNECMFITTSGNGLHAFDLAGAQNNTFTGNIIFNWGQSASNTYDGFFLHAQSGTNSIFNSFTGNSIISNAVTNHMRYGFNEADINQDFNSYIGNIINGMATAPIRTQGIHSHAMGNIGYNPVASSTVTAGASVWTYTNNDGYSEKMVLSTVNGQTAETCSGVATTNPTTIGNFCLLDIGQSLTATWATTAPIYTKVPMD